MRKKILCVFGTRPEAIKMIPIILCFKKAPWVDLEVLFTAQHQDLVLSTLSLFNVTPDFTIKGVMKKNQSLSLLASKLIYKIDNILERNHYDLVLAQGDTTTTFATALASFYRKMIFGHVEAGLRSGNKLSPFPEEMNRLQISPIADFHFCPTEESKDNLLREGVPASKLYITGNTIVDAVRLVKEKTSTSAMQNLKFKNVVITLHRRENLGRNHLRVLESIRFLANKMKHVNFIFSVHPNPDVSLSTYNVLKNIENVKLFEAKALDYASFISILNNCHFIVTDSGGIQEEALALQKPVLVLRAETERIEGLKVGAAKLVHPLTGDIEGEITRLLDEKSYYESMITSKCPYGDGYAAEKILNTLYDFFFVKNSPNSENLQQQAS